MGKETFTNPLEAVVNDAWSSYADVGAVAGL